MLTWASDIEGHGWVLYRNTQFPTGRPVVHLWTWEWQSLDGHGPVHQRLVESERFGLDESLCRERGNRRGISKRGPIRTRP